MAILGLGRTPANVAGAFAGSGTAGNSMGIDYAKLAQEDALRNANNRQAGASAPSGQSQAQAAWEEAMGLLQKPGPYTPEVINQLTNRRADQTAAAEAVNAEEIRNQAAARGMDPTQALRGLQQGRQAQNVAFSGDIASQGAVQNYAAETQGRLMAAQANLNRQFGGGTQPAVYGGGGGGGTPAPAPRPAPVGNTAFSGTTRGGQGPVSAGGSAPTQKKPLSVAERNALQAAWEKGTNNGMKVYGASHMPGYGGTGRDPKTGALQNPYQVSATRAANTAAPTTAFSGAPTITPQAQAQIDAANIKAAPPLNTKLKLPVQYPQGSRTLPMTNPFDAFR